MRAAFGKASLKSSFALTAALALAPPALAQDTGSVSDYRLPDPNQPARPQPQGPIDPDNPWIVRSSPGAEERETPSPAPAATPRPVPAPRVTPPAPAPAATQQPATRPTQAPPPSPAAAPSPSASATPTTPASPVTATPEAVPASHPAPEAEVTAPAGDAAASAEPQSSVEESEGASIWLLGGALAAALAAGAFLLLRRRRAVAPRENEATDVSTSPLPDAQPQPSPPARTRAGGVTPAKAPAPKPVATPSPPSPPQPTTAAASADEPLSLSMTFAPHAVRLSLVYATLQYELEVANAGSQALPELQVRADLASAHASIGTREQLAPPPEQLEVRHAVPALAPGETAHLKGEVRVPLQQIRPLVKGNARFFVPLARFCFLSPTGAAVRRVFTIGQPNPNGSGALASVRLDAGPRNLRELEAREIEAARGFALDPVGAHG